MVGLWDLLPDRGARAVVLRLRPAALSALANLPHRHHRSPRDHRPVYWGLRSNGTENTLKRDRVIHRFSLSLRTSPAAALRAFGVADIPHDESAPATQRCSAQESSHVHAPAARGAPHLYHRDGGLRHTAASTLDPYRWCSTGQCS